MNTWHLPMQFTDVSIKCPMKTVKINPQFELLIYLFPIFFLYLSHNYFWTFIPNPPATAPISPPFRSRGTAGSSPQIGFAEGRKPPFFRSASAWPGTHPTRLSCATAAWEVPKRVRIQGKNGQTLQETMGFPIFRFFWWGSHCLTILPPYFWWVFPENLRWTIRGRLRYGSWVAGTHTVSQATKINHLNIELLVSAPVIVNMHRSGSLANKINKNPSDRDRYRFSMNIKHIEPRTWNKAMLRRISCTMVRLARLLETRWGWHDRPHRFGLYPFFKVWKPLLLHVHQSMSYLQKRYLLYSITYVYIYICMYIYIYIDNFWRSF